MNLRSENAPPRRWATIPNAITLLRLALVVPIALLVIEHALPELTVILLVIFGASDWIDGYLARRLGQTSSVGAVLDPVADRIGVAVIVVALAAAGSLPLWVPLLVAFVDVALIVIFLVKRPADTPDVSRLGKIRTAVLMSGIALVGLALLPGLHLIGAAGDVLCMVGAPLHAIAALDYGRRMLRAPGAA